MRQFMKRTNIALSLLGLIAVYYSFDAARLMFVLYEHFVEPLVQ